MTIETQKPRQSATAKLMDYLARRDHSELELRQKLGRHYSADEIDRAVAYAKESKWMSPPAELSERVAITLGRKRKGHRFINQFLKTKGLPAVAKDLEEEVRKSLELIAAKLDKTPPFDYEEKGKIHRLLTNRGFDDETIRLVLKEK